jgi:subtilisin-like proprotein convertase family protein
MWSVWTLRSLAKRWMGGYSGRLDAPRRKRRRSLIAGKTQLGVERLEDRTLLSVLPPPVVSNQQFIDGAYPFPNTNPPTTPTDYFSSPSVAIDPVNPNKAVAVFADFNVVSGITFMSGSSTLDGGKTWLNFSFEIPGPMRDPNLPAGPNDIYTQSSNPTVAIGNSEQVYVVYTEHDAGFASNALVLQKFDFSGINTFPVLDPVVQDQILYQAVGQDPIYNAQVIVDNNLADFRDPDVFKALQADPNANPTRDPLKDHVYVAYDISYKDKGTQSPTMILASADGAQSFTGQHFLSSSFFGNGLDTGAPALSVAQGTTSTRPAGPGVTPVPAGSIHAVFSVTDPMTGQTGIDHNVITDGGAAVFLPGSPGPIKNAIHNATAPDTPQTTEFDFNVDPTQIPANFTISDLKVSLALIHPNTQQLSIVLQAPDGSQVTLLNNGLDAFNKTTGVGLTAASVNLGVLNGVDVGTVFDQLSPRPITSKTFATSPFIAHFQPETSPADTNQTAGLDTWNGQRLASLAGTWKLLITDFFDETSGGAPPTQGVDAVSLRFSSGLDNNLFDDTIVPVEPAPILPGFLGGAPTGAPYGPYALKPAVSPNRGIGPAPTIAIDNTLGAFSPYQGRIYVAYVLAPPQTMGKPDDTNIVLTTSDDNGVSWTAGTIINDDIPTLDGFSEGDRAQFMPTLQVDQATGSVVIQYEDARWDAARQRISTFMDVSIDGGQSFTQSFYLNQPKQAVDAITKKVVNLEPTPDNQQQIGNALAQTSFGFGDHTGLAVFSGHAISVWGGNQNAPGAGILSATTNFAAGPRVVSSDQGPVADVYTYTDPVTKVVTTYNNTFASDGTRQFDSFEVTFDRPISISSFDASDVQVVFRDPFTPANLPGTAVAVASVQALDGGDSFGPGTSGLDANGNPFLAEHFLVHLQSPQSSIGTYSYTIGSNILDSIRTVRGVLAPDGPNLHLDSADVPQPIMSNISGTAVTTSKITVNTGNPQDLIDFFKVTLSIQYPFVQDLDVQLFAPSGKSVQLLVADFTTSGANYTNTSFDDAATQLIQNSSAPYTGTFLPAVPLSTLQGLPANGTWTLQIIDRFPRPGFNGQLTAWSLDLQPGLVPNQVTPVGAPIDQTATDTPIDFSSNAGNSIVASSININDGVPTHLVAGVTVKISIMYPFVQDLRISLIAPDGQRVPLVFENTLTGANYTNTNFDDNSPNSIFLGSAPFTGTFAPESPLGDLVGRLLNGTWMLEVNDSFNRSGFSGQILSWSLHVQPGVLPSNTRPGNAMDQNANGIAGEPLVLTPGSSSLGDAFAAPTPTTNKPFLFPYSQDTLPIIIPGPHVIQTFVPGLDANNNPLNPPSGDNLVLNRPVNAIDVVFDRDMDPSTFTTAQLLRLFGPYGRIPLFDKEDAFGNPLPGANPLPGVTVTPDPNPGFPRQIDGVTVTGADPDPAHPRTFRIGLPTRATLPGGTGLDLSGTYEVTLSSDIQSASGVKVDNNLNAGLDVLRSTPSSSTAVNVVAFPSINVPQTIPAGRTIVSTLGINTDFAIQTITLKLNISFPFDPSLSATLLAPDGRTTIQLFSGVGTLGPTRKDFLDTVFDDTAQTPIQQGMPPFPGSYNPQQPLSVLKNTDAAGQWKLIITNSGTQTGTLNSWSLSLGEPIPSTGLGEPVADQFSAHFRIFTQDPTLPLPHNVWTPVGGASLNSNANSGRIGGLALDPSDTTGNTVYAAGASGGVWKTTNFLTSDPNGPTWTPLTDFGPTFAINIGSIAVFPRNNDPRQSIIIASTGEGDTGSRGVGFLRSLDGGATWTLLDSTTNFDSQGNELPIGSPLRDHAFVGTTSFKVIVDPKPTPQGGVIIYAALSGTDGGIWRSTDSGAHWSQMRAGQATDVVFDDMSTGANGNLQTIFGAFQGEGVFYNTSAPTSSFWNSMPGVGFNTLIRDADFTTPPALPVTINGSPSGAKGRISLAAPLRTNNPAENLAYAGWLYALVATTDGHLDGLYVTKDFGANWTKVALSTFDIQNDTLNANPTNDDTQKNYDVFGGGSATQGNYDQSITLDPTNPNIVYIGGTRDGQSSSLLRVNTTGLSDAHAFFAFDNRDPDGGLVQTATTGAITIKDTTKIWGLATSPFTFPPDVVYDPTPYLNLIRDPANPFVSNATLYTSNIRGFTNDGGDATWVPFDGALAGTTDHHRVFSFIDPLTGHARLVWGDDQGIFTAVDNGDGTFNVGIGSDAAAFGPRSGNLQITQFYFGAVQPSIVAAQVAGALFYGSAQDDGFPQSDPNELQNGNIGWSGPLGDGGGVATDQTGTGTVYQYAWPCCGGNNTDFFLVNGIGRTGQSGASLLQAGDNPSQNQGQWPNTGAINFAVNPIDPNGIVISSSVGRVFRTTDQGLDWFPIGEPTDLDSSHADALAFGAPAIGNRVPLDDFIYAGTDNGDIFVTFTGGGKQGSNSWISISSGLDGKPVRRIVADTARGSHDAYAITTDGVFFMADSSAANAKWVNITGNLFSLTHVPFGDPNLTEPQLGYLSAIVADWRYVIPDDPNNPTGPTHPALYVGGEGGVYRSLDKGTTWTPFPDVADGSPVQGGYLPNAHVTDLQLSVGNLDPLTGKPDQSGGPNILMASTYGRGSFAIALPLTSPFNKVDGPHIVTVSPDPSIPRNSVVGLDQITVTFAATINPATFNASDVTLTGPGGVNIPITLADVTSPPPGALNEHNMWQVSFPHQSTYGTYTLSIVPNITDWAGHPMDQDLDENGGTDNDGDALTADAFVGNFVIAGLKVVNVTPDPTMPVPTPPGLSTITATFNGPVDPASFDTSDITVTDPNGNPVTVQSVSDATIGTTNRHDTWTITLATGQLLPGNYSLTIGPDITDTGDGGFSPGNNEQNMDQDEDGAPFGQVPSDQYSTVFTVPALRVVSSSPPTSQPVLEPPGFSDVVLTFNREVDPTTFDGTDVSLIAPDGSTIVVSQVKDVTPPPPAGQQNLHNMWEIDFPNQTVPGVYTLTLGPNIDDSTGTPMDQDQDGGPFGQADDVFVAKYDIDGLAVTSVSADNSVPNDLAVPVPAGVQSMTVTFNQAVLASTLTNANVVLKDPNNNTITITGFNPVDTAGKVWQITFASQTTYGTYTLTIGPGVEDLAGNAMNQNHNSTFGESGAAPGGDAFQTTFTIAGLQVVSPIAPNPTRPVLEPPGLSTITVTFNMAVDPASFTTGEVSLLAPDGTPITLLSLTDVTAGTPNLHNVWQITLPSAEVIPGIYKLTVGPDIHDLGGNPMDQDEDNDIQNPDNTPTNDDAFTALYDIDGLKVLSVTPSDPKHPVPVGLTSLTITFNQAVLASTMNGTNVVLTDPNNNNVTLTGFTPDATGTVWTVTFAAQNVYGTYTLNVGPGVEDLAGNAMNQNHNLIFGENPGDKFTTTFSIAGLKVLTVSPSGSATPILEPPGLSAVTLTFNMNVDPTSFTAGDVNFTAPDGTAITNFTLTDITTGTPNRHNVWRLTFPSALVTPGVYNLTVGPDIHDLGGNPMDQDEDNDILNPDDTPTNDDAFTTAFDIDGLAVTSVATIAPAGASNAGVSQLTITFNQAVLASTMNATNVLLNGPAGAITLKTFTPDATGKVWAVTFAPQFVSGTYSLSVLPGVEDLLGHMMNQNHNLVYGEAGAAPAGDEFDTTFNIDGLRVVSVTPDPTKTILEPPGMSSITITFNREVIPSSFTIGDVSLTAPTGSNLTGLILSDITPTPPAGQPNLHNVWQLNFPVQSTPGVFTLVVGPHISDSTGSEMDQNMNLVFGENGVAPAGDQFKAQFDIDGLAVKSVDVANTTVPVGLKQVLITFNQGVLAASMNTTNVTLTGPNGPISPLNFVDVNPGLHNVWKVTFAAQSAYGTYTLNVSPNVQDLAGNAMNQNHNAVFGESGVSPAGDGYQTMFSILPLRIVASTPSAPVAALSAVTVTFDMPIDPKTFTTGDASLLAPDGTVVAPLTVTDATLGTTNLHNIWQLLFPTQSVPGTYTLTVGPSINDNGGNAMDQNQNGTPGEVPGDQFVTTFVIPGASGGSGGSTGNGAFTGMGDVTGLVSILPRKAHKKHGKIYTQVVNIFNISHAPIQGPFALLLQGLPRSVRVLSANGVTTQTPPVGTPFQVVVFGAGTLDSVGGGTFVITYFNPRRRKIQPAMRLLAGIVAP